MLGQRRSPLLIYCRSIVYNAGPTLIHHWVCCVLCANTSHSPNTVSMLTHSLRRWHDIEKELGDCTVFSDCCTGVTIQVTLTIPAPETPGNTIHWHNADVMLGHCLRGWGPQTLYWTCSYGLVYRNGNRFPRTAPLFSLHRTHTQAI